MTYGFSDLRKTFAYSTAAGLSSVATLEVDEIVDLINQALYSLRDLPEGMRFVDDVLLKESIWYDQIGTISLDVAFTMLDMGRVGSYQSSMDYLHSLARSTKDAVKAGNPAPNVLPTMLSVAAAWANYQDNNVSVRA